MIKIYHKNYSIGGRKSSRLLYIDKYSIDLKAINKCQAISLVVVQLDIQQVFKNNKINKVIHLQD